MLGWRSVGWRRSGLGAGLGGAPYPRNTDYITYRRRDAEQGHAGGRREGLLEEDQQQSPIRGQVSGSNPGGEWELKQEPSSCSGTEVDLVARGQGLTPLGVGAVLEAPAKAQGGRWPKGKGVTGRRQLNGSDCGGCTWGGRLITTGEEASLRHQTAGEGEVRHTPMPGMQGRGWDPLATHVCGMAKGTDRGTQLPGVVQAKGGRAPGGQASWEGIPHWTWVWGGMAGQAKATAGKSLCRGMPGGHHLRGVPHPGRLVGGAGWPWTPGRIIPWGL